MLFGQIAVVFGIVIVGVWSATQWTGGSGLVAVVVAIAMSVWRSRQSKLVTTYGSARWADPAGPV